MDHFLANSGTVQRRIAKAYRRASTVIHPPVATPHARPPKPVEERAGYAVLGRLVPYKNAAPVVEAFRRSGRRLTVVGDGPELARLRAAAGPETRFVTDADDAAVAEWLGSVRALVFAAEEDFGLVPVEALAAGTPVVSLGRGGATETLSDGESAVFFDVPTPEAINGAIDRFEAGGVSRTPEELAESADRWSSERFRAAVRGFVERAREKDLASGPPAWKDRP